ncbi:ComF family protein [Lactiplantibacillus nangangensis]|uniref:ComF family protein n=1 Tax=Lactiplantibacillus nangangensis TaxID=2559917 RepID=A0ABW1SI96_9LACO|nr:ComF family protein [Lactiplantibacillus nangangensis]
MPVCLLCQRPSDVKLTLPWVLSWQPLLQPVVCAACWQTFTPIIASQACPDCGRAQPSRNPCHDCRRWGPLAFYNQALFTYNDAMQAYFEQYKFKGDYRLRRVFSQALLTRLASLKSAIVVAIPVTPETMTTRGFNQVTGWLAEGENSDWLRTKGQTKLIPQSKKTRQDRLLTAQPFELTATAPKLANQTVVIVDDVYTTGRTMRHAASLILENGAKSVVGLTLAR